MKRLFPFCPSCGSLLPDYPGAVSRQDNKTEICSDCGMIEAFSDYAQSFKGPSAEYADSKQKDR